MDLGLNGRNAVICASSQGLGRACALELARAGCTVVINGRDAETLERAAAEIRQRDRWHGHCGRGRCRDARGPGGAAGAVPTRSISWSTTTAARRAGTSGRSTGKHSRRRCRQHGDADRTGAAGDRRDGRATVRPDRQHHLGFGQDAAGRTRSVERGPCRADRLPGRCRPLGRACQCDDQLPAARFIRYRRLQSGQAAAAKRLGIPVETIADRRRAEIPAQRFGEPPNSVRPARSFVRVMRAT